MPSMNASTSSEAPADNQAIARFLDLEATMADRLFEAQRQMSDISLTLVGEAIDFTTRRLRAQMAYVESLCRCADPQTLLDAQFRFVASTTEDYAAEMATLAQTIQTAQAPQPPQTAPWEKPKHSGGRANLAQAAE